MKILDRTFDTPEENLACDEALLDLCERGLEGETLRFWQPRDYFVVLGYSNKAATEVSLPACRASGVPVLRRFSGGGTVLQGPGCLNYSLVLDMRRPAIGPTITASNLYVMKRHQQALSGLLKKEVGIEGFTDLTLGPLKFSGNAQRRKRGFLLFHGTFLVGFDLPLMEKFLPLPTTQPGYRKGRAHGDFLTNIDASSEAIKATLAASWSAEERLEGLPLERIKQLSEGVYRNEDWTLRY